jgi:hypothetical protein
VKQRLRRSRMLGWDHNPLRRRIDRVEAGLVAALVVVFLITAPVLAAVASHWTRAAGMRQQRAELAWRHVRATVTRSAAAQDSYPGPSDIVWKPARWTAPDGRARTGAVPVRSGAAAGSSTRIWVSRSGSLTGPPLQHRQLQGRMVMAGVLTGSVLGFLCVLGGIAGRSLLGRRRLADWDRTWRTLGPQWTRQS